MGTSASSNGPGAGVSLDPAWIDDIELPGDNKSNSENSSDNDGISPIIAPRARFSSARRNLNDYVRSGSTDSLRKSLGHYSRTGMGGSSNIANRMRASSRVAAGFVSAFRALRDDPDCNLGKTIAELKATGANAREIIKAIVNTVCPDGGSIDEQLSKNSGTMALSEFMENHPDADISNLSDDQIWSLTGEYIGNEAFGRIQMDIGQSFERSDVSIIERVQRTNEMREYIKAEIYTQLNLVRQSSDQQTNVEQMIKSAIENTFSVYEMEVDA